MPFLAQEGASPPLDLSRLSRFAPDERKKPAALTARATKREGPPRRAFASFFQAEKTLEEKKKEGTKCQKDNMPLGENYCARRSRSRGECSKLTPPFTITAFGNERVAGIVEITNVRDEGKPYVSDADRKIRRERGR